MIRDYHPGFGTEVLSKLVLHKEYHMAQLARVEQELDLRLRTPHTRNVLFSADSAFSFAAHTLTNLAFIKLCVNEYT
jgi:hypothetical protein